MYVNSVWYITASSIFLLQVVQMIANFEQLVKPSGGWAVKNMSFP